jgi:protein-disulfide isomerase
MRLATFLLVAAVLGLVPVLARAQNTSTAPSSSFTAAQRAEVEAIIKDYLVKEHPEVLMEAANELEKREQADSTKKSEDAIGRVQDKIFNDPDTPVSGNPKGDVTVVEFFDYQCGYCKMSEDAVEKLLAEDKNVRFVYKDYPILGPESVTAAKASLAAARQPGKFVAFHDALMKKRDHMTDDLIYQTAKDAGLDVDRLKKDMNDPAIQKIISDNLDLGNTIGVRGTPMFLIGDHIYPGAIMYDQLKKQVQDERSGAKKP